MIRKTVVAGGAAAGAIALDQASKAIVLARFAENETVPVVPGLFDLTLRYNTGAAFSLFDTKPSLFFFFVSVAAIGALVYFLSQLETRQIAQTAALGAVLGGAIGNLLDRARFGAVVDFLLFSVRGFAWPAFNVADAMIVAGVAVFLVQSYRDDKARPPAKVL
ncbi:signal peptidase II [bacterium]|nr:signal peptidase II [bacterium]